MKITELIIKKLHSTYNYDVIFNSDLTFLYGENGCGKTTILNIIEALVSGYLFDLFIWNFESISLMYIDNTGNRALNKKILVEYKDTDLAIRCENNDCLIEKSFFLRCCDEAETHDDIYNIMSARFPILGELQKKFNYLYLPLNRYSSVTRNYFNNRRYDRFDRRMRFYDDSDGRVIKDEETISVARLIEARFTEATAKINSINDSFRNNVLKSLLATNENLSEEIFLNFIKETIQNKNIDTIKEQYISLLNSFSLLEPGDRVKYTRFFDSYKRNIEQMVKSQKEGIDVKIPISLIYDFHEIEKMQSVIALAQEAEEEKRNALSKINLFIDTMNAFININSEKKRIVIGDTGKIRFASKYDEEGVSISNLSSGEKQLLIFFANLIFRVNHHSPSIFVVDEPELSLHLSWQKMFVEKAIQINPNIQFIFATHSPEIVGRFRNRMFKLEKIVE